jgi:uncharacterized LabA/DUF88 family protein
MLFVDGENLAMRWRSQHEKKQVPSHVEYEPDVFVWSRYLNMEKHACCNIVRRHYYTSAGRDIDYQEGIADRLKSLGLEAPRVFPRTKSRKSKRVDVTLSVDMLAHAYQKNYDVAVLVAGDEDYVPLVEAVKNAGRRVFLWFCQAGLSPALKHSSDYYFDIAAILCEPNAERYFSRVG